MDPDLDQNLDPNRDDLPLRANTSHMLVRHYVLDLTVHFATEVISGSVVLFLETGRGAARFCRAELGTQPSPAYTNHASGLECPAFDSASEAEACGGMTGGTLDKGCCHGGMQSSTEADGGAQSSKEEAWEVGTHGDFVLVLDCCDLAVERVEEVDVASVPAMGVLGVGGGESSCDWQVGGPSTYLIHRLVSMPSSQWELQHDFYSQCSRAPTPPGGGDLLFCTDRWSLQIRKRGVQTPQAFPHALRIWYQTKPEGASVRWTRDQSGRPCVYTSGSPINNRALFPCQEPPVAMSTWQACVRAPSDCVVLLSGENEARPDLEKTGFSRWDYHVTMPMPASTFTVAVGHWVEAKAPPASTAETDPDTAAETEAQAQAVIPHRVFAPSCLLQGAAVTLLPLLPPCLAAAHAILGVHPFPRLDVLIVPPGFSSLGMASPHIMFLSQSVLSGERHLSGSRLCHEIAHAWFGLAIGARDWTEEWISEGFATYLEDVFWAQAQQLSSQEAEDQCKLKALLRWRRLRDELQNSEEELQILRPNKESTGEVSESGASVVKHALNPGKSFMQVHYLKGYFLLKFLASKIGEEQFLSFFHLFVHKYHGQLILSQDFLRMLFGHFPKLQRQGLTLEAVYADWLDQPGIPETLLRGGEACFQSSLLEEVKEELVKWIHFGGCHGKSRKRKRAGPKVNFRELTPDQLVLLLELLLEEEELSVTSLRMLEKTYGLQGRDAEVRHRWCELVVKHKHAAAYRDVERFLMQDQAMGVYLYGELMLHEDTRQQALARCCFARAREDMDPAARAVVEEMIL
ncbi:hypothetical protein MATL_G00064230 [Megalops atlanticus]|uniref:Aminopeptidase O n=1 Tax=Megalops atlanticus TaxID=7932 RepID=A0A9D3T9L7_MEGAT|nr:hypothetical protein MATL_G00064230 [Megalops atlanticus]